MGSRTSSTSQKPDFTKSLKSSETPSAFSYSTRSSGFGGMAGRASGGDQVRSSVTAIRTRMSSLVTFQTMKSSAKLSGPS